MIKVYLCYILFLSPLAEASSNDTSDNASNSASDFSIRYNNTVCLDCREENKGCNISDTGYVCKLSSTFDSENVGSTTLSDTPISRDLDVCLPEGLDIKEEHIGNCCVWSPKIGCQILQREREPYEDCFSCYLKCPCDLSGLFSLATIVRSHLILQITTSILWLSH
ncbi:uncharacterized protein LOC119552039 [Drosophila subpulchrella]|uniref:uncharacterized protein LOC119552039 n=1 Tax=Drosophila subpulchrella TaxID=1486046 RepID=UPI0018A151DF|nr:uncharacterized protein LOC119552039 [Drosophila subpulchrella]